MNRSWAVGGYPTPDLANTTKPLYRSIEMLLGPVGEQFLCYFAIITWIANRDIPIFFRGWEVDNGMPLTGGS